tara:strand:+ start:2392 stop:2730 length:339 start_codon:yes stop_codon:yes gene_type:complete
MAIGVTTGGESLKTNVSVRSGRKKLYDNEAIVVEAFKQKHIKVDLVDEDDHHFKLNWDGTKYEGNFFGTTLSCDYEVTRDFKADISAPERSETGSTVYATRSNGGRPNRYQE